MNIDLYTLLNFENLGPNVLWMLIVVGNAKIHISCPFTFQSSPPSQKYNFNSMIFPSIIKGDGEIEIEVPEI